MKIYDSILTKAGDLRSCRHCDKPARVRSRRGGCVYCLDHYLVEVGMSCGLGSRLARYKAESIRFIGPWLTAALRRAYAHQHVLASYPEIMTTTQTFARKIPEPPS